MLQSCLLWGKQSVAETEIICQALNKGYSLLTNKSCWKHLLCRSKKAFFKTLLLSACNRQESPKKHLKPTLGLPSGTSGKEPACQCRRYKRCGSIPGSGRSRGWGHGNPLQKSSSVRSTEEPGRLSPYGRNESDTTEANPHSCKPTLNIMTEVYSEGNIIYC